MAGERGIILRDYFAREELAADVALMILGGLIIIAVYILYFVGVAGGAGAKDLMDTGAEMVVGVAAHDKGIGTGSSLNGAVKLLMLFQIYILPIIRN